MVFLDSAGKLGRIADAERVRRWVEANHHMINPAAATRQPSLAAAHVAS
jgi:D-alanyl-D-alanine endopeptidase (penicillin-binding protein 7)